MISLITNKPFVGYVGAAVGFFSGLLTILKVLTPILGFAGALFGAVAGLITLILKIREWKKSNK
jgi:membrane associated rhomboid family serine protease